MNINTIILSFLLLTMQRLTSSFRLVGASNIIGKSAPVRFRSSNKNRYPLDRSVSLIPDIFDLFSSNLDLIPSVPSAVPTNLHMDIKETETEYEVVVDVPGVDKKDIDVAVRDNHLLISAHRADIQKEERGNYRRIERYTGHVTRSVALPPNANADEIDAQNKDGVLHIKIPKSEHTKDTLKKIDVK